MAKTILAVIELDNYPEIVTQRAAWLAELCEAELTLMLCEPKAGLLNDSIFMAAEVQQIAELAALLLPRPNQGGLPVARHPRARRRHHRAVRAAETDVRRQGGSLPPRVRTRQHDRY